MDENKNLTRENIADLLGSVGKPGEKREEKLQAVKELEKKNFQGYPLESTLNDYEEW